MILYYRLHVCRIYIYNTYAIRHEYSKTRIRNRNRLTNQNSLLFLYYYQMVINNDLQKIMAIVMIWDNIQWALVELL